MLISSRSCTKKTVCNSFSHLQVSREIDQKSKALEKQGALKANGTAKQQRAVEEKGTNRKPVSRVEQITGVERRLL